MDDSEVEEKAKFFAPQYTVDISSDLVQEILHLKSIHASNLGEKLLNPICLLNKLACRDIFDGFVSKLLRGTAY